MKLNKVLFGLVLVASAELALAANPAPVIDISQYRNQNTAPKSVSEQIASIERKLDARNRAQVNIQRQLDDLHNELNEIRGVTELHTHQLSQVLERQRELYQELDKRLSNASNNSSNTAVQTATSSNLNDVVYSSNSAENKAYEKAVNLVLKDKRYEEAIPEFKAFNLKYPNSAYSANAHYWLGQLLSNKNDLTLAKAEFEIIYNNYKKSPKRSDAMLKLADVEKKLNNQASAKRLLLEIVTKYPTSSAAKLAKTQLKNL